MENEGINLLMAEYEENVNVVAKINAELCRMYGLEHYLSEFSSNLIRALNQYKRFVLMMPDRRGFVESILRFSEACIHFFRENDDPKKDNYKDAMEKMTTLTKRIEEINDLINKNIAEGVKEYLQ